LSEEIRKLKKQHTVLLDTKQLTWGIKVAAGWLDEQCGWRGKKDVGTAGGTIKQALKYYSEP